MAQEFLPKDISQITRKDRKFRAEVLFYDSLKLESQKNNESIYVYWNVDYLHEYTAKPGECDFIIILPNHGMAYIEIKGGGISFSSVDKVWTSDNGLETFTIKDPFKQAMVAEREMSRKIKKVVPNIFLPSFSFVGFVDITKASLSSQKLPPNAISEIIITRDDIEKKGILHKIKNLFNKKKPSDLLNFHLLDSEVKAIRSIISPDFELKPKLVKQLETEKKEIVFLSDEQIQTFKILKNKKRAFIEGGAGTGKTFIAVKKARELADQGLHTLFLSHSRTLTRYVRKVYFNGEKYENLRIASPFLLTKKLAQRNNIDFREELSVFTDQDKKFNEGYPSLLIKILKAIGDNKIFDAIVVDEGQRFNDDWWLAIEEMIPKDGILFAFYDPNQNLFSKITSDYLTEQQEDSFPLSVNYRNTKEIFKISENLYKGVEIESVGPTGRPIEWIKAFSFEQQNIKIALTIERFLSEGVSPNDIGVINFGPIAIKGGLQETLRQRNININLDGLLSKEKNFISYDSVAHFQGHEVPIVILTNFTEKLTEDSIADLYTSLTRASHHLVIVASENVIKDIKNLTSLS